MDVGAADGAGEASAAAGDGSKKGSETKGSSSRRLMLQQSLASSVSLSLCSSRARNSFPTCLPLTASTCGCHQQQCGGAVADVMEQQVGGKYFGSLPFTGLRERETGPVPASPRSAACMPGTSFSLVRQTRGLCRRRTGLRAGRDECAVSQPETAVHAIAPCFDPKTETDTGVHVPSGRFFLLLLLAKLLLVASHPSQR